MTLRSRRFASILIGGSALVLAASSAPAHAGRSNACKAPPFAVPKETQRAVDAAIDARVVGTGSGGASSGVAVRTDYDTITLSQDAVARAWASYTLCLQLAKKLISQELHDELLRGLMSPNTAVRALDVQEGGPPAPATGAPEIDVLGALPADEDIVGSWQVVSSFQWSTCPAPNNSYGVAAYGWLLGVDASGAVEITVLGQTAYPALKGQYQEGRLVATGDMASSIPGSVERMAVYGDGSALIYQPRSVIAVQFEEGGFHGTRDVLILDGPHATASEQERADLRYTPCLVRFNLEGRR